MGMKLVKLPATNLEQNLINANMAGLKYILPKMHIGRGKEEQKITYFPLNL